MGYGGIGDEALVGSVSDPDNFNKQILYNTYIYIYTIHMNIYVKGCCVEDGCACEIDWLTLR